jgi:hypothetical protein
MISQHAHVSRHATSAELEFLQRFFDDLCEREKLAKNTPSAKKKAALLVELYEHGIRDKRQLAAILSGRTFP